MLRFLSNAFMSICIFSFIDLRAFLFDRLAGLVYMFHLQSVIFREVFLTVFIGIFPISKRYPFGVQKLTFCVVKACLLEGKSLPFKL